ncbi:hypothetical protein [Vibrio paracholerae]|uniref:hypothetical protein n=1 Tax=Vibrio paracholerae TaxID=650003 RepID=UPI0011BF6411|nr:hypothetical protein [Vibrio paracholerae]
MNEVDKKYHDLAKHALFHNLYDYQFQGDVSLIVEKSEILKAFNYSGDILRSNLGDEDYRIMAEVVFETCIRLVRCLFFPIEARNIILRGREYSITAEQQLEVLRRNLNILEASES